MQVDKTSFTPLYKQLFYIICQQIQNGTLPLGSQLPTQKAIAQTYNVSLIVVKQAWSELINAGVITSQRGSGSVVSAVPEGVSYGHTFAGSPATCVMPAWRLRTAFWRSPHAGRVMRRKMV